MANNQTPHALNDVFTAGEDGENGAIKHAEKLKHNTAPAIRADLSGAQTAQAAFKAAETTLRTAITAATAADEEAKKFLAAMKKTMEAALGNSWSPLYGELGFIPVSREMPSTKADRFTMVSNVRDFFTNHPEYADPRPLVNVTAESAAALYESLKAARAAVDAAEEDRAGAMTARDAAVTKLRNRLSSLLAELTHTLSPSDEAWYAFGLTPPANPSLPSEVDGRVTIRPAGQGQIEVNWEGARRATRYAVYVMVNGVDVEPVRVASVRERTYLLKALPSGKAIEISVAGVNRAGQGPVSDSVEATLPMAGS